MRPCSNQLLPCRIPFDGPQLDLAPAIQGYSLHAVSDARRFVELRRLSAPWDAPCNWSLRLIECMLLLEQNLPEIAWRELQAALAWRNAREKEAVLLDALPPIKISEWLILATVALAVSKTETAETYASEAISRIQNETTFSVGEVLQDTRADAMTVFAAIKLHQGLLQEAEMLLQLAHDAHVQAGDMEQIVVDLILMADVELFSGNSEATMYLLFEAETMLTEECDPTRHLRCQKFLKVVHHRLVAGQSEFCSNNGRCCLN